MYILTILNSLALIAIVIFYFKENYVIVKTSTWNAIAEQLEELANNELPGGEGFFKEYLGEEEVEE